MARPDSAADLAQRLAGDAEAVCRHYLPDGRRTGRYWQVGDITGAPGRSLFVRLKGPPSGKGAAGKWTDAASGEHGDLLDVIRARCELTDFRAVADEARRFLSLPLWEPGPQFQSASEPGGSPQSARRLFAMAAPIRGTVVETYLRHRAITEFRETRSLRFHPRCYYRPDEHVATQTWPAMIGAVTDLEGRITGAHRTWLDPSGTDKAPVETPRRSMGQILGNGVRFGIADDVMAAGEGIETVLSLRCAFPNLPMIAATSANHLAAIVFPPTLRRLYIARDDDPAGHTATATLVERAMSAGIEAIALDPQFDDVNTDLRTLGIDALRSALRPQIAPDDVARFASR